MSPISGKYIIPHPEICHFLLIFMSHMEAVYIQISVNSGTTSETGSSQAKIFGSCKQTFPLPAHHIAEITFVHELSL